MTATMQWEGSWHWIDAAKVPEEGPPRALGEMIAGGREPTLYHVYLTGSGRIVARAMGTTNWFVLTPKPH